MSRPGAPDWENPPNMKPVKTVPPGTICGICLDTLTEPHQTECGHIFCRTCILPWLARNIVDDADHRVRCPMCRSNMYAGDTTDDEFHFITLPFVLRDSGILNGRFTAGAGLGIFTTAADWQHDVLRAVDSLQHRPDNPGDSPCKFESVSSTREFVIYANIAAAGMKHQHPSLRERREIWPVYDRCVTEIARGMLSSPKSLSTASTLSRALHQEALDACVNIAPGLANNPFFMLSTYVDPNDYAIGSLISESLLHVIRNGVQRSLGVFIQRVFRSN